MEELEGVKLTICGVLFVLTVLSTASPWLIRSKFKRTATILSYFNCFAAGVVLGTFLLHMIPEMLERGNGGNDHNNGHSHHGHSNHSHSHHAHSHHAHSHHSHAHHAQSHGHSEHAEHRSFGPLFAGLSFLALFAIDRLVGFGHNHDHDHSHELEHKESKTANEETVKSARVAPPTCCEGREYAESCHSVDLVGGCHMDYLTNETTRAQAMIFILALSVHSFLEGLAIGPLNKGLLSFSIGLISHKILESFALGVSIMKAKFTGTTNIMIVFFYSILTPAGCGLGLLLKNVFNGTRSSKITFDILNGLAAGSFLFVSCIEMIPPEFHKKNHHSKFKFLVMCLGFLMIALISFLAPHEH